MISPHILKLPTPRLLAYYKKHYHGTNPFSDWDWNDEGREQDAEFEKDRAILKQELDSREHVEN